MAPRTHAPLPPPAPLSCPQGEGTALGVPWGSGPQSIRDPWAEGSSRPKPLRSGLPRWVEVVWPLPPPPPLSPHFPGPRVSRAAAARPGGRNVLGQIPALLSQVSHPCGSVLMSLNPCSLFSAPGNSHIAADTVCPGSLGSSPNVTTDQLLEIMCVLSHFRPQFLYL